jgi:hypothetical protein
MGKIMDKALTFSFSGSLLDVVTFCGSFSVIGGIVGSVASVFASCSTGSSGVVGVVGVGVGVVSVGWVVAAERQDNVVAVGLKKPSNFFISLAHLDFGAGIGLLINQGERITSSFVNVLSNCGG